MRFLVKASCLFIDSAKLCCVGMTGGEVNDTKVNNRHD